MELSEKIQKLRKERGLTQEQLADMLFVSRTAVSKWETGRGTPSIESLQMISKIFEITLDDLIKTDEILIVAQNEKAQNLNRFALYVDGVFNISTVLSLLLPLYKTKLNNIFYSVPLYQFGGWLKCIFWLFPITMMLCGIIQLLISKSDCEKAKSIITILGIMVNVCAIILLILGNQPYPSILFFIFLLIKSAVLFIKHK